MEKENLIIAAIVALVIVALLFIFSQGASTETAVSQKAGNNAYATKTSQGEVTIELTPHKVQGRKFSVDITMDTHSVALDTLNLKELITLEYDGQTAQPASAPSFSGHHASGIIIFDVTKEPSTFTILIKSVPDVEVREIVWP